MSSTILMLAMRGTVARASWAMLGVLLFVGGPLSAHHSYATFDLEHPITVEGTLVSFLFANPHSILTLRTDNGAIYTVTWHGIQTLQRVGIRETTLNAGDRIVVTGAPYRDPAVHQLSVVTAVRRPSDGWVWNRSRR